jgi:hypothetical protein
MNETGWHYQVVDESYGGRHVSLALTNDGLPSISYLDTGEERLQYTQYEGSSWETQTVDRYDGYVGWYSTLALDSSDHACIAYTDIYRAITAIYSCRSMTNWEAETVAHDAYHLSIDIDQADCPHLTFCRWYPPIVTDLVYGHRNDTGWSTEIVADDREDGHSSLDLDGSGRPRASFIGLLDDGWYLRYATHDESTWSVANVYHASQWLGSTSLQLDTIGLPHIAFQERYPTALMYARIDGADWIIETVDDDANVGFNPSLAVDNDLHIHIVYQHGTDYDLKYAYRNTFGWFVEVVDSVGHVGITPSIVVDAACNPHVAYSGDPAGGTDHELRYAFRSFSGWHIETVDTVGSTGGYSSISLDTQGRPHISYFEGNNGDVKYAWKSESIDMILSGTVAQGDLILNWAPALGSECWLYGAPNLAFFLPGFAPGYDFRIAILPSSVTTWQSPAGVGNPFENWTYLVIAVDDAENVLGESNRAGEHDFEMGTPGFKEAK